jgi:hypothetical protein
VKRALLLPLAGIFLVGCSRLDMQDQPKYKPQRPSDFFADGRSGRPEIEGTVARGEMQEDNAFFTGKDEQGADLEAFPVPVDKAFIERGRGRYDIYCAPCHGRLGNGLGMIVRRGFKQPPSYHIERLRSAPVGHFYEVITNGYGAMLNYASQVQPRDRWAIIAYIRALQFSQNVNAGELSAELRGKLPQPGQESAEQKAALKMQPLVPNDSDFMNFPAMPATPAGVPGAFGAGANKPSNQPERK